MTLPTALNVANTTLIWSEVSYTYKPTIGYVVTGTLNLSDQIYMRPRLSDTVDAACRDRRWHRAAQGIGSAVVDLIFSMAKREVTFLSGTAAISCL